MKKEIVTLTREEAEKKIIDKECDDIKEAISFNDLSYLADILAIGIKGYLNFTNKELENEIAEQFNVRDKTNFKFKIVKS